MVRAILDGRKTQTRRVIKPQPGDIHRDLLRINYHCPYGQPGDHLWVRETWSPWADEATKQAARGKDPVLYRADYRKGCSALEIGGDYNWKSSIYMPRWASRITLEIIGVHVERIQDISVNDCMAEGIPINISGMNIVYFFRDLWDSINKKRGYGWDTNPYVWVIEFKRISQ
jgi:hypothetical protein